MALCAQRLNSGGGLVKNGLSGNAERVRTKFSGIAVEVNSRKREPARSMPAVHLRRVALNLALCAQRLNSGGGLVKNGLLDTDLVRTKGKRTLAKAVLMHSRKRKTAGSMPGIHLRRVALNLALCAQRLNSGGGLVKNGLPDPGLERTEGERAGVVTGRYIPCAANLCAADFKANLCAEDFREATKQARRRIGGGVRKLGSGKARASPARGDLAGGAMRKVGSVEERPEKAEAEKGDGRQIYMLRYNCKRNDCTLIRRASGASEFPRIVKNCTRTWLQPTRVYT